MSDRFFTEEFLRRLENIAIATRRITAGKMQGERRSTKRGQSVEFSDFRAYVPGDDFRRIDWNAYARLERLFIKLFVEEEDLTIHILLDVSRSMNWGQPNKLDYSAHVAGALGYIALVGLDRVTVTAVGAGKRGLSDGGVFSPHRGKIHALSLFQYLQSTAEKSKNIPYTTFSPSLELRAYANLNAPGSSQQSGSIILISDLEDDGWKEGIGTLAANGYEISVIHILSPDETDPQMQGDVKLIDCEDGSEVEITADYDLIERYKRDLTGWQEELHRFCSTRGVLYIPLETSLDLEELLFSWLEKQGVLR